MYNQYLKTKASKNGTGVFTEVTIPANVPIIEFTGTIFGHAPANQEYLQIGVGLYLGVSGAIDDYINHSCKPNCVLHIVGRRAILYSKYVITANTELNFDYSTSSTDTHETWKMNCSCGAQNCRKVISGIQYLDDETINKMKQEDMLPLFITSSMFRTNA